MPADWIKLPTARKVLVHWADARPAWLWSQDGETLLWRNDAARFFHGKIKKQGIKLAPDAVPIRGQIARLIRLGLLGRSSLSRIQFLAGQRPISTTCLCTPLELEDGSLALLIVGVDPIEPELLEALDPARVDPLSTGLFPEGSEFLLVSDDSQIVGGSPHALEHYAPMIESEGLPELAQDGSGEVALGGERLRLTRFTASPQDAMLLLFERLDEPAQDIEAIRAEEGIAPELEREPLPPPLQPLLPMGLPEAPSVDEETASPQQDWVEAIADAQVQPPGTLSSLFDRLADDDGLYSALGVADEQFQGPPPELPETVFVETPAEPPASEAPAEVEDAEAEESRDDIDAIAALINEATATPPSESQPVTWRIVGRGFKATDQPTATLEDEALPTLGGPPDAETVERVSRYNFDELSRILTDRVANPAPAAPEPAAPPGLAPEGALISLAGETFILNRLPLGILVFRDQQVLFANRALTELAGYDSIEQLRGAGLTAIFPAEEVAVAGPVTQLVRRDGTLAPVNARLQSISWHGKPALMLSANLTEPRTGHEAAVRTFAELHASLVDEGFITADRAGIVTSVSLRGRILLAHAESDLVGKPIAALIEPTGIPDLKRFLERPARFAETARPSIVLASHEPGTQLILLAEGQAGVVASYFGFIRKVLKPVAQSAPTPPRDDPEPSMLVRISRGVRRPLNTIIGFSDLIRSAAFGSIENQRYLEYARDIKSAGEEIATLVDELDDYTRLREGRYPAQSDDVELCSLLDACLMRVKSQAAEARVLVRNGVSERLPHITADRASLTQAILNLLASAIDQTSPGGTVILSAQQEEDGAIVVNVRDSGERRTDLGERFVVFRDGVGKDGERLAPVRSSVGLALTRSLLAVNALSLNVDPTAGVGTMFSLVIPADLVRTE